MFFGSFEDVFELGLINDSIPDLVLGPLFVGLEFLLFRNSLGYLAWLLSLIEVSLTQHLLLCLLEQLR